MKKLLFILFALMAICNYSIAQNKITRYVEIVTQKYNNRRTDINMSISRVDSLFSFKDSTIKINLNKVSTFNTVPDALNYMASLGWTLITATFDHSVLEIRFYFKKEFDQSEISKY
jgi:hypothetical protein